MDVYWGFDSEGLMLQMGSSQAHASATGEWQGIARCSPKFAFALIEALPDTKTVSLRVEGGKLYVGGSSATCMWDDRQGSLASIPLAGDLESLLALRIQHNPQELERAGLINMVLEAERKRNNMISRAVTALRPLGITRGDLLELLEERLKRRYQNKP